MTIKEIISAAGGGKVLAERFELTQAAVSVWQHSGIPTRYWAELMRAAEERGRSDVTMERIRKADTELRSLGAGRMAGK